MSPQAIEIIDNLANAGCQWFIDNVNPTTGLVRDRCPNIDIQKPVTNQASISSTGFYLSLLPELVRRKRVTEGEAIDRAAATLSFVSKNIDHVGGILLHFVDWKTGRRWGNSEFATLDTAIFLNGCMVAAEAYPPVHKAADELINRVEWTGLWPAPKSEPPLLSYGFSGADRSALPASANVRSAENLMPCLLAAGVVDHPVPRACWYNAAINRWEQLRSPLRTPINESGDYGKLHAEVLNPTYPLFTSQYGLIWAKLEGLHDADGIDLWQNARLAALFNRAYCREIAAKHSRTYSIDTGGWWGISAGDGAGGNYVAPGPVEGDPRGTVWPTAALGSIQWAQDVLDQDVRSWKQSAAWNRANGKYGLSPFSLDRNWTGNDLIGIDVGCFVCAWSNVQSGIIQRLWGNHPVAKAGIRALEFSRA